MAIKNFGRLNNFISGITGVTPGGSASLNMNTDSRVHRLNFQTSGIGYGIGGTIPTAVPTVTDAGVTFTPVVVNGVITSISGSGTSTLAPGDHDITITGGDYTQLDGTVIALGTGATATYTVDSSTSSNISAVTVTGGGSIGPLPPELVLTTWKEQVNGVVMCDITPSNVIRRALANPTNGWSLVTGEFPIFKTEPWRNLNHHNEITSWDLIGQNSWQFSFGIASNITSPLVVGSFEFDYERNQRPTMVAGKKTMVPFLQPIKLHQFSYPVGSGRFDLTVLPKDFPISRIWVYETDLTTGVRLGHGSIYQIEIFQDGNKVLEQTLAQNDQTLKEYGFDVSIYDAAFVSDIDQRLHKALHCEKQLILRVYSAQAANLNVVMETLPGAFQ